MEGQNKRETTWGMIQGGLKKLAVISASIRDISVRINQRILVPSPEPTKAVNPPKADVMQGPVFGYLIGANDVIYQDLIEAQTKLSEIEREL